MFTDSSASFVMPWGRPAGGPAAHAIRPVRFSQTVLGFSRIGEGTKRLLKSLWGAGRPAGVGIDKRSACPGRRDMPAGVRFCEVVVDIGSDRTHTANLSRDFDPVAV